MASRRPHRNRPTARTMAHPTTTMMLQYISDTDCDIPMVKAASAKAPAKANTEEYRAPRAGMFCSLTIHDSAYSPPSMKALIGCTM